MMYNGAIWQFNPLWYSIGAFVLLLIFAAIGYFVGVKYGH